eukprot:3563910-Pyramimonas_sp.AAC.1
MGHVLCYFLLGMLIAHISAVGRAIDAPLGMAASGRVSRAPPLRAMNYNSVHHLSYPADVSQQGTFGQLLQVLTGQKLKDRLSARGKNGINAKTTTFKHAPKLRGR